VTERLSTPQVSLSPFPACLIASFFSLFSLPVHPVSGARPARLLILSLPLLCSSHCFYPVLTASTKMPVGTDMYINSPPHCRGQPTNQQLEVLAFRLEPFVCAFVPSCTPLFPLSLSLSTVPLGRQNYHRSRRTYTHLPSFDLLSPRRIPFTPSRIHESAQLPQPDFLTYTIRES